jgi:hypothetical protein
VVGSNADTLAVNLKKETAMIKKHILNVERVRCINGGFAFIPHRFLTDGFVSALDPHQLFW